MVSVLVVATSGITPVTAAEVQQGLQQRIDYLELVTFLRDRNIEAAYIDYTSLTDRTRLATWFENRLRLDIRLAISARKRVQQDAFSSVYSMSERVGIPLAYLLPKDVVHIMHEVHLFSPEKLRLLKRAGTLNRWDICLTYSRAEQQKLETELMSGKRCASFVPEKVDTQFWDPRKLPGDYRSGDRYIMAVGASHRDYATLLSALTVVPEIHAEIYPGSSWVKDAFVKVGDGQHGNIKLQPRVKPYTLRQHYAGSRFVVVPLSVSTQWSAGGNAVLEAQSMGRPVIATRTPGMPDYVLDGETGILVEPENPHELAAAIDALWNDESRCQRMGERARKWVESEFSLERWLSRMVNILV